MDRCISSVELTTFDQTMHYTKLSWRKYVLNSIEFSIFTVLSAINKIEYMYNQKYILKIQN